MSASTVIGHTHPDQVQDHEHHDTGGQGQSAPPHRGRDPGGVSEDREQRAGTKHEDRHDRRTPPR